MFKTDLLDKALEDNKTRREKKRSCLLEKVRETLGRMREIIPFEEAYIFGTITKPYRFFDESDVDVGFVGLSDEDFFRSIAWLTEELEREVDVLQMERHRLKEKIIREGLPWKKQD